MIQVKELSFRYPQNNRGIGSFSFSVKPGEILHITGASGCGKSTMARCIAGLIPHLYRGTMQGDVVVRGRTTADTPMWELSELAGFVFQNPSLQMLGNTVEEEIVIGLENLGLEQSEISERLEESLKRFGMSDMRHRSPQTLSGGEQQKLALAAIIARGPRVLVLDEPLSMLDVTAAYELVDYLIELSRAGTAIIIFEHRADYLVGIPGIRIMQLDYGSKLEKTPIPGNTKTGALSLKNMELKIDGLSVRKEGNDILNNINFMAHSGEVTAIVGRNGIGKTTMLRAITGLQKHEGCIDINGEAPDFGQVYQNADLQLFNATVRSEILYRVKDPDMSLYLWLIEVLGLGNYENVPPLILSEGEKKRVALATVLMRKPAHGILLDEPSLGQDAAHRAMLINICRSLASHGKIVIYTTHELHLASFADRMILLGKYGIEADGRPEEVFLDDQAWERTGMFVPGWIKYFGRDGITA